MRFKFFSCEYFNCLIYVFLIINYILIIFWGRLAALSGQGGHRPAVGVTGPRPIREENLASLSKWSRIPSPSGRDEDSWSSSGHCWHPGEGNLRSSWAVLQRERACERLAHRVHSPDRQLGWRRHRGRLRGGEQRGIPYLVPPCLQGATAAQTTLPDEF